MAKPKMVTHSGTAQVFKTRVGVPKKKDSKEPGSVVKEPEPTETEEG